MAIVEKLERRSWALVKACNKDKNFKKLRKEYSKLQKIPPKKFYASTNKCSQKIRLYCF